MHTTMSLSPKAPDALDGISVNLQIITILDESFVGDWEIVHLEDWILRPKLRKIIASKVTEAITRLRDAALITPPEMEPQSRPNLKTASNAVQGYLFPLKTWERMMEDDRLP